MVTPEIEISELMYGCLTGADFIIARSETFAFIQNQQEHRIFSPKGKIKEY
jgi:hypothetical protein